MVRTNSDMEASPNRSCVLTYSLTVNSKTYSLTVHESSTGSCLFILFIYFYLFIFFISSFRLFLID